MIPTRWQCWTRKEGDEAYIATMDNNYLINCYKWLAKKKKRHGIRWVLWSKDGFKWTEWQESFEKELEKRNLDSEELYLIFKE